jgi:hypothetical protein
MLPQKWPNHHSEKGWKEWSYHLVVEGIQELQQLFRERMDGVELSVVEGEEGVKRATRLLD